MQMNYKNWENNHKIFIIENGKEYTYGALYEAIGNLEKTLTSDFLNNCHYLLEAENSFYSYVRFITLIKNGNSVLMCSYAQFTNVEYLSKIISETKLQFIKWSLSQKKPERNLIKTDLASSSRFIVRTSGSTGENFKLVIHDPDLFFKKYKTIGPHFLRTFAFSPAGSIAGIETLLEVLVHELTLVSSINELSPSRVVEYIKLYQVDYFQTTPTYMNLMIIAGQVRSEYLNGLKKIAYGSEPSLSFVVKYFQKELPELEMMHTYGMSEIGIQKTLTKCDEPTFFLIDDKYNQFKINEGVLEVRSMTKMLGYLNAKEIPSSLGADWFYTSDEVLVENQFLKVLGRLGELINIAGNKFFPSELEDVIRKLHGVADVLVTAEVSNLMGKIIVATITTLPNIDENELRVSFKKYCEENIVRYMHPHRVKIKKDLDQVVNAKKNRVQ